MKNTFNSIKNWIEKQSFQTNFLSIFFNNFLFIRRNMYRFIKENAEELQGELLDFGCGKKPYQALFSHTSKYVGVDILLSGHSHQQSKVDVFYDGKTLPFESESFDSLFCSEVVEHLFELDILLKELNRVLKPNATAIFTFPFAWQEHEKPYDFARYTSFASKAILEKQGFEILKYEKSGSYLITLWQLFINYIFSIFARKGKRTYNKLMTLLFIFPLNLIGLLLELIPSNKDLYLSNLLLVKKK